MTWPSGAMFPQNVRGWRASFRRTGRACRNAVRPETRSFSPSPATLDVAATVAGAKGAGQRAQRVDVSKSGERSTARRPDRNGTVSGKQVK